MAFFRFNRDKRGYEYFSLVQPVTNRRGKVRSRVLYWFRTPPGVRVGREPFDERVRRALEMQNPGVTFDWPTILDAPIPSADTDKWRERRRADRTARQSFALEDPDLGDAPAESADVDAPARDRLPPGEQELSDAPVMAAAPARSAPIAADATRQRRRRRRVRRGGVPAQPGEPVPERTSDPAEWVDPGEPAGD